MLQLYKAMLSPCDAGRGELGNLYIGITSRYAQSEMLMENYLNEVDDSSLPFIVHNDKGPSRIS